MIFTKKRSDGTYVRNLHFFTRIMPYIMPARSDACIYFEQEFDVTKTLKYIKKRKNDTEGLSISLFYIILYAAIRTISQRPKLNRFVSGYRHYQRNRISFNFVVKRDLTDDGEEINITMSFSPLLTIEGFCRKINERISSIKKGTSTSVEKVNSVVSSLPRSLIKLFIWGIRFLDYHNALPKAAIDSLPFYSTIFFTNVGSVGIDAPFHHNFEIGNCGIFCAIGKLKKVNILTKDGIVETHDKIKLTVTYDDRITDGIYCARAMDIVRDLVENPENLEIPPELTEEQMESLGLTREELNNI